MQPNNKRQNSEYNDSEPDVKRQCIKLDHMETLPHRIQYYVIDTVHDTGHMIDVMYDTWLQIWKSLTVKDTENKNMKPNNKRQRLECNDVDHTTKRQCLSSNNRSSEDRSVRFHCYKSQNMMQMQIHIVDSYWNEIRITQSVGRAKHHPS